MKLATALSALLLAAFTSVAPAQAPFRVYAPSSKGKSLWIVDAKPNPDGTLELKLVQKTELGFAPGVITAHPRKPLLYVCAANGKQGDTPGAVISLSPDGSYAKHQQVQLNDPACYISLDRNNAYLLGVNYGNGQLNVYKLDENGIPQKAVATIDEGKKEAHCVLVSPDNQFLYIPYVKGNLALLQYRFDAATGKVTPLAPLNANPPQGTGPRHLVYHPKLPVVYFTNEQGLGLSSYERRADGQLVLRQNLEALPQGMSKEGLSASDLEITPDGKFLFAGLRGHTQNFDRITRYRLKDNGDAELLGLTPTDKIPWGLSLSPDGRYLLVSATTGATLTAYQITPEGDLKKAASFPWDAEIYDLITLPSQR